MLIRRFKYICSQNPSSAIFMWENKTITGFNEEEGLFGAMKHGTLGLTEIIKILIEQYHTTKEGMKLAKRIEQLFKDRCTEFKEKYKFNFGVYYTPAENLCHTAMKKFKQKYGEI